MQSLLNLQGERPFSITPTQCTLNTNCMYPQKSKCGSTSWFCDTCSARAKSKIFLCNKTRGHEGNESLTCNQIWHNMWGSGEFKPHSARIRQRPSGRPSNSAGTSAET